MAKIVVPSYHPLGFPKSCPLCGNKFGFNSENFCGSTDYNMYCGKVILNQSHYLNSVTMNGLNVNSQSVSWRFIEGFSVTQTCHSMPDTIYTVIYDIKNYKVPYKNILYESNELIPFESLLTAEKIANFLIL